MQDDSFELVLDSRPVVENLWIALPPTPHLLLRDADGKTWAISVATDGQLQTAKVLSGGYDAVSDGTH